jgi:hypothetical protein
MSDLSGQFGRYVLLEKLGEGGMGVVYKAQDPLGRTVALKVMQPELRANPDFVQRFTREARLAASLDHPNVVTVYDVGEHGGCHYFSMQFVEGTSLDRVMAAGRMPLDRAAEIVEQAAAALEAAHAKGIVHRDIKPQNILIDRENRVRITDFGIARAVEGSIYTTAGRLIGTPEYMSPEQASGHPVDGRSDIYSLGVLLYQMATGTVPFSTPSPIGTAMQHVKDPPLPPRRLRPDLPQAVERVIMRALEKDPQRRYQTPSALAGDLRLAVTPQAMPQQRPSAAATRAAPQPAQSTPGAARRPARMSPGLVAAIVGVLGCGGLAFMGMMALVAIGAFTPDPDPEPVPPPTPFYQEQLSTTVPTFIGSLGMSARPIGIEDAPGTAGVVVTGVAPEGPADTVGVQVGDVIGVVGNVTVRTPEELEQAFLADASNGVVSLGGTRGGEYMAWTVVLQPGDSSKAAQ